MSYTLNFSLALGPGKAGLTDLRAQLVTSSGTNSGTAISTGFAEIGSGNYIWNYASFADDFRGGVKFYSNAAASTVLAFAAINPEEAEYTNAKTSTRSTLTTSDIDARLAAYDAATGTEAAAILTAIAALNNLSSAGAQAAAAAALAAYDAATGTDVTSIGVIVAAQNPTPNKAGAITMQRGATFDATLTGLSIPVSWTSARLTVKRLSGDSDESAVLQILVSNPGSGSDGLQRINGSTSGVIAANASLIVNQAGGTIAIHIEDDATILLAAGVYCYDCKIYYGTSDSMATAIAAWNINGIVTAAV